MIRYFIVRHGETEYNVTDRVQGWCDSPLTQNGIKQASEAGRKLADIGFDHAACGDLGRHVETAKIILSQNRSGHIPDVQIDPAFRESYFGGFEERPITQLLEAVSRYCDDNFSRFSEFRTKYSLHEITDIVNGADPTHAAEPANVITGRFYRGLMDLAEKVEADQGSEYCQANMLVVTSGAVFPLFMEYLQSAGGLKESSRSIQDVKNAEVFVLEYDGDMFDLKSNEDKDVVNV